MSYSGENEVKHVGIQYAGAIHVLRWPQLKIEIIDLFDPIIQYDTKRWFFRICLHLFYTNNTHVHEG